MSKTSKEKYWKNPEKWRAYHLTQYYKTPYHVRREQRFIKSYGITLTDWNEQFKKQKGRCALCCRKVKLHVDHDHKTKRFRGLLCPSCNSRLIGFIETYKIPVERIMRYLCES